MLQGRRATFGEIVAEAAAVPILTEVSLKNPKEWTFIGNPNLPRIDAREKSIGRELFTIDVKLPGMLTAVMIHPPLFGATVKSFEPTRAKAVKGVVDVVSTPRGIAVVGENMWAAIKGREEATVEWDASRAEKRSTSDIAASWRPFRDAGRRALTPFHHARRYRVLPWNCPAARFASSAEPAIVKPKMARC
jgi:isoquinoline 1-oxidoreductase beta subunit